MLPTTPSDLDLLPPWIAQNVQDALSESRNQARQICAEATAACATAAELRQETAQRRQRARQLRSVMGQLLAAGVRRRLKAHA